MQQDRLRSLVSQIEVDMADAPQIKRDRWTELVGLLALEPSSARRECPFCKAMAMKDATRCGFCWKALPEHGGSVTSS